MNENNNNHNDQPREKQKASDQTKVEYREISIDELKQIYNDHIKWIKSRREAGKRADLRLANLKGLKLKKAVLAYADLQQTNLFRVKVARATGLAPRW